MKLGNMNAKFAKIALACSVLILALVPFHALLTVWLASWLGHYTALRLWSLALLVLAFICVKVIFWRDKRLHKMVFGEWLMRAIVIYIGIELIWGVTALATHHVTAKALAYGWIVNVRFLLFFPVTWLLASKTGWLRAHWQKLVFWPAAVVIVIGLLQYFVLPYDFLKHFGYSSGTIYPYETINHNIHHIRIMSTLRGANPLGAYLVVVLSLLLAQLVRRRQKRLGTALLGLGGLLALIFSFSRSAWIGFILAAIIILVSFYYRSEHARRWLVGAAVLVVLGGAGIALAAAHSTTLQDAFLHTDSQSKIAESSNQGHVSALKSGVRDMLHEPLGRGPGTAGPASEYNTGHPVRIAENYFIQITQETGWLGLITFLCINVLLALKLWARHSDPLALGLFAALIGVSVVNLFSHAWTDDTLAYLFWGLAGVAIVKLPPKKHES